VTYERLWLAYFALTVTVELLVAVPLLRGAGPGAEGSVGRRIGAVLVANLASHPLVWFVLVHLFASRAAYVLVTETWAVASEAAIYAIVFPHVPRARALGISAMANGASFLVGLVVQRVLAA
jgi:hypothetical protein